MPEDISEVTYVAFSHACIQVRWKFHAIISKTISMTYHELGTFPAVAKKEEPILMEPGS